MNEPTERTSDGDLMSRLTDTAAQMTVPGDGLGRIDARAAHRRRRRTTERALAAVAAFVLVIGGVVALAGQRDDEGLPVVTEPVPTDTAGPTPIAPADAPWFVTGYSNRPVGDEPSGYSVGFDVDGHRWGLTTSSDRMSRVLRRPELDAIEAATSPEGTPVELLRDDGGESFGLLAVWDDPDGGPMLLRPEAPITEDDAPSTDEILAIVDSLEPVDDATWFEALTPPDDTQAPDGSGTTRPLRLGRPDLTGSTRITLSPWTSSFSEIDLGLGTGFGDHDVSLAVETQSRPPESAPAVEVRGTQGTVSEGSYAAAGDAGEYPAPDQWIETRMISWLEAGSWIQLTSPKSWPIEQAVQFADSLVVLDDTQWEALLFPTVNPAPPVETSTTTTVPDVTATEAEMLRFCEVGAPMLAVTPESYVGSPEHYDDVARLGDVAPPELREDFVTYIKFLQSGAITDDPESKTGANWPADVQAAVEAIRLTLQAC